jgi:hypothetical protein
MNPDFSLSDWMKNWGTLKLTTVSTYEWRENGEQANPRCMTVVEFLQTTMSERSPTLRRGGPASPKIQKVRSN